MLELNQAEQALLLEILREQVNPLSTEINRTDSIEYKDDLKARARVLDKVIHKLELQLAQPRSMEVGDLSGRGQYISPHET